MAIKSRPCQRCGTINPEERLEIVPETRLCVKCSQETGGDTRLRVSTRRMGKAGSLKRTGTDIESVEIVRRRLPPEE
jgi:hypothetical protein